MAIELYSTSWTRELGFILFFFLKLFSNSCNSQEKLKIRSINIIARYEFPMSVWYSEMFTKWYLNLTSMLSIHKNCPERHGGWFSGLLVRLAHRHYLGTWSWSRFPTPLHLECYSLSLWAFWGFEILEHAKQRPAVIHSHPIPERQASNILPLLAFQMQCYLCHLSLVSVAWAAASMSPLSFKGR